MGLLQVMTDRLDRSVVCGVCGVGEWMVVQVVSGGSLRYLCCNTFSSHVRNDVGTISSVGQMAGRETWGSKIEMD